MLEFLRIMLDARSEDRDERGASAVEYGLLIAGIAALVLPGPGLLMVFAGMAVLSQQYDWAERRVEPLRLRAMRAAAYGVAKPSRIVASGLGVLWMWAWGVVWCLQPSVPSWWSLPDSFWLPGGLATGVSLVASGFLALALLAWSYRRFHGQPEELRELERDRWPAPLPPRSRPRRGAASRSRGSSTSTPC